MVLELWEAERLIQEGWRPYIRKTPKGEYITLKRGSKERGVGPFDQQLWEKLDSLWTLVTYGFQGKTESQEHAREPKVELKEDEAESIFAWLEMGYDPAQIVRMEGYHPDKVEYAVKRYYELKGLKPQSKALQELTEKCDGLIRKYGDAAEAALKIAKLVMDVGEFKFKTCRYAEEDGSCDVGWSESIKPPLINFETIKISIGLFVNERVVAKPSKLWCALCPAYRTK